MHNTTLRVRTLPVRPARLACGGFTLIELVVVIVLLAILAAVAIPRFVSLEADAQAASVRAVAGAITSASSINYVARKARPGSGVNVTDCANATDLLSGGLPAGYNMGPVGFPLPIASETSASCTVYGPGGTTAQATLWGI